jgi:hypothetical protein
MHMSNQTGFDYEVMISRLHGGLCAFQSLRAHRRQRAQAAAPRARDRGAQDARATTAPRAPPISTTSRELHATGSLEPQAFVAVGDRVVPLFGT